MKIPKPKDVLKLLESVNDRPMRSKEMSRRLGVPQEGKQIFSKVIRRMVSKGKLKRLRDGKYALPNRTNDTGKQQKGIKPPNKITKDLLKDGKILGKFLKTGKTGKLLPRDERIPHIELKPGEFDDLKNDDLVVFEVDKSKSHIFKIKGKIVDNLGKAGDLDTERSALLLDYGLSNDFRSDTLREIDQIPIEIPKSELKKRVDLRDEIIVTIDDETAKDFDDAVGIHKTDKGYKLLICIADVSYYVRPGSAIDNESLSRGTSVYMPHNVVPMLPEVLSNNLCSLVPEEDRLTKTIEIHFNSQGEITGSKIYNSVIRSTARLTYTEVSDRLNKRGGAPAKFKKILPKLRLMNDLYEKIRVIRIQKGELSFDIPEPNLIRDELGRTIDVVKSQRYIAHGIIEEFMIAANMVAATFLFDKDVASIYRIHERPEIDSYKELVEGLKRLGYHLHQGNFDTLELQGVINKSKGRPEEVAVNMLILRSLKRALYSTEGEGHFGLALDHYTHFTSPIRRYPDLIIHRLINSVLNKQNQNYDLDSLEWICEHSSKKERQADQAERDAINLERAYMMKSNVGKEYEGVVISVLPFGMFIELNEVFVEGLVPKESVPNWRNRWFDVGQKVKVKIVASNLEKRRIRLNLVH